MTRHWTLIAALALLPALSPTGAAAQNACDTLQGFVDKAPDGFSSLIAGLAGDYSLDAALERRPATVSWGGAPCTVSSDSGVFRCSFENASYKESVDFIAGCMPAAKKTLGPEETYFIVPTTKVTVSVYDSDGSGAIMVEIRRP